MSTSYQSIACALHDELEIAIMHKKTISILWQDEKGVQQQEMVIASDVVVKNKQESLIFNTRRVDAQKVGGLMTNDLADQPVDRTEYCIRLDKITLLTR